MPGTAMGAPQHSVGLDTFRHGRSKRVGRQVLWVNNYVFPIRVMARWFLILIMYVSPRNTEFTSIASAT